MSLTTTEENQVAALRRVINHPDAWAKLMDDEDRQQAILDMPHCTDILEDAIIAHDNERFMGEEEIYVNESEDADCFADLDPGEEEPARGNFGMRMAKIRKAKRKATPKTTKKRKATPKKKSPVFTYRVKTYKTKTVGNVCDGVPRKAKSLHTIAYEELADGKVWNRVMVGTTQDRVIRANN